MGAVEGSERKKEGSKREKEERGVHSEQTYDEVAAARGRAIATSGTLASVAPLRGGARERDGKMDKHGDICGENGEFRERETAGTRP